MGSETRTTVREVLLTRWSKRFMLGSFATRLTSPGRGRRIPMAAAHGDALLCRGDIDLPKGSSAYALLRERATPSLAASDLLS